MKKRSILTAGIALILNLSAPPSLARAEAPQGWLTLKGKHFIVYYEGKDRAFPGRVLDRSESYYATLAAALGYSRRSDFWLWDKRGTIYLFASKETFHRSTQEQEWLGGFAIPAKRTIVSYQDAENFLHSVLPHEITHLIFRDFIGINKQNIPLWLEEGIATMLETNKRKNLEDLVSQMIKNKTWIPVKRLGGIDSTKGLSAEEAALFYAQSQSLVRYLLDSSKEKQFSNFCRDLRDSAAFERALEKNYRKQFPSIAALEHKWTADHA